MPQRNRLLTALPPEVQSRLIPQLELIALPLGTVIYESGGALRYVYFLIDCIISLLYVMESGASAEISVIGNEGLVGVSVFKGGRNHIKSGNRTERWLGLSTADSAAEG